MNYDAINTFGNVSCITLCIFAAIWLIIHRKDIF